MPKFSSCSKGKEYPIRKEDWTKGKELKMDKNIKKYTVISKT